MTHFDSESCIANGEYKDSGPGGVLQLHSICVMKSLGLVIMFRNPSFGH